MTAPADAHTGRRIGGRVNVPVPTDNIAQRGNAFTRAVSILLMRLTGWHFTGEHFPVDVRKFVLIVAPHTSNWDFPVGVMAKYALGIRGTFLGKHTLFRFPLGLVMRWLGGLPVDRSSAHDVVTQTVHLVERSDRIIVVLSPEGTRKRTDRWRTGFWWIAHKAGLPILPVAFDYSKRAIHVCPLFQPTGDVDADVNALRQLFHASMAYDPAKYAE
jgi:1-acyl-sn-glycerol-3-phosphate acyltransferase